LLIPKRSKILVINIENMLPLLFDEMYEGKAHEFRKLSYQAVSVRELRDMGFRLQYDYSIISYTSKNRMILITEDNESYGGCMENQIPCVKLGQNPSNDEIIEKLKKFENLS
jgi:predicted nuclease of predicted toxin-antitoxin system